MRLPSEIMEQKYPFSEEIKNVDLNRLEIYTFYSVKCGLRTLKDLNDVSGKDSKSALK